MSCPSVEIYFAIMPNIDKSSAKTLAELGVLLAGPGRAFFAEVHTRLRCRGGGIHDEASWKAFREGWLGRKSGMLAQITDNWLKPASPELKRAVGAALNELRAHVEAKIEARRIAIEAGVEQAAAAKESRGPLAAGRHPASRFAAFDSPGLQEIEECSCPSDFPWSKVRRLKLLTTISKR